MMIDYLPTIFAFNLPVPQALTNEIDYRSIIAKAKTIGLLDVITTFKILF
jgi:hypothetical protein